MGSSSLFWNLGSKFINHSEHDNMNIGMRRYKSFFGVSPLICEKCWKLLDGNRPRGSKPVHLLWTFLFLKQYNTEHVNHSVTNVDEKTFRKWVWIFIYLLAELDLISWEKRLDTPHFIEDQRVFISLDGVDFRIEEPTPFSPKWYSHKFKSAGLKYEVGISIAGGNIVWVHGGFPCGEFSDLKIARNLVVTMLNRGEKILGDKGYKDRHFFLNPFNIHHKKILARHETVNRKLKVFNILNGRFRHSLHKHSVCVHAIANITQLSIKIEEPLYRL